MGYLNLKSVLQRYFPTPNINYGNLNYFTRDAAGALRAPMSAISGDVQKLHNRAARVMTGDKYDVH